MVAYHLQTVGPTTPPGGVDSERKHDKELGACPLGRLGVLRPGPGGAQAPGLYFRATPVSRLIAVVVFLLTA